jgi:hypothetical protein
VIFYFIIQIKRDKSKNMLMLIIIKKYEKVIKRDKKKKRMAAHYRGMAFSLPNIASKPISICYCVEK